MGKAYHKRRVRVRLPPPEQKNNIKAMKLKHKYTTDKSIPDGDEYWSFAFYGWLLLEHDKGGFLEVDANYATPNQVKIERIVNGKFSGNWNDYTIIGYKIRKDKLMKNRPQFNMIK